MWTHRRTYSEGTHESLSGENKKEQLVPLFLSPHHSSYIFFCLVLSCYLLLCLPISCPLLPFISLSCYLLHSLALSCSILLFVLLFPFAYIALSHSNLVFLLSVILFSVFPFCIFSYSFFFTPHGPLYSPQFLSVPLCSSLFLSLTLCSSLFLFVPLFPYLFLHLLLSSSIPFTFLLWAFILSLLTHIMGLRRNRCIDRVSCES